ncbi:MAG: hypothetical protein IJY93_00260 [Clostridia bacterium]|nr:hypothetical protein [Clostridia bacterium]
MRQCNQTLRNIADASALKQSVIPVFVCDDELLVASKSIGAKKNFSRPAVNGNIANHIPDDAVSRISDGDTLPFCTQFKSTTAQSYAIITQGTVNGENYRALVIEPQIVFLRTHDAWYISCAFSNLEKTVNDLINSKAVPISRLELCCLRISRLCAFSNQRLLPVETDIAQGLLDIMEECTSTLINIGGHAEFHVKPQTIFSTYCSKKHIYILTSAILVAAIPISHEGNIDIYLDIDQKNDRVKIRHTITLAEDYREGINSIDDFIKRVPHLSLELAALKDMAEQCRIAFDCYSENGTLTVFYEIYAQRTDIVVFNAPIDEGSEMRYLSRLFEYFYNVSELDDAS